VYQWLFILFIVVVEYDRLKNLLSDHPDAFRCH
jgi:hypothetical protein